MSVCYFPVCIPAHHVQFVSSLPVLAASTVLFSVLYRNEIMVRGLRAVTVCLAGATLFFGVVFALEYYHVGSQAFQREELIHKALGGIWNRKFLPSLLFSLKEKCPERMGIGEGRIPTAGLASANWW